MTAPYAIKLSPKLVEVLNTMIALAEENEVVTLAYGLLETQEKTIFVLTVGDKRQRIEGLQENPLLALSALNLIQWWGRNPQSGDLFLTKEAFDLVAYQRKGRFRRWLQRMFQSGKDVILIAVAGLTVALTVLQILQLLHVIKP